jgi:hypothetical protein
MTVTNSTNKILIAGNGSQTIFGFGFIGVAASDISVIVTNSSGVSTTLTRGPGLMQFQLTLNSPAPGQLWGVAGTVTYNPGGTPIPSGSTLTILRTVPNQQDVSLQNQGSFGQYAVAAEQMGDLLEMQIQQTAEAQSRVISAPVVDPPTINLTLPPAAQRANQGLAFDGSGNVIAGTIPSSGIISSAMQPVVAAASLAVGRTALGLGAIATEGIGGGLQDDGAGNARVIFTQVADATSQSVDSTFHLTQRTATGALSYTLQRANTLFNGFGFWVYALDDSVIFSPNAADNFSGMASGASLVIPPGSQAFVTTDGVATWFINLSNSASLNAPLNLALNVQAGSNDLGINLGDRNFNFPSTASPILVTFRDSVVGDGDVTSLAITGPLSIVVPPGATLGTVDGQANRIWIGVFNNGGTPVLGVFNALSGTSILPWDETSPATGTNITSGSNTAGT